MPQRFRPFYKTIVEDIESISDTSSALVYENMTLLARQLKRAEISENHDEILRAWNQKCEKTGFRDTGVVASILQQKREAEIAAQLAREQIDE